jgi:hypothetical protein
LVSQASKHQWLPNLYQHCAAGLLHYMVYLEEVAAAVPSKQKLACLVVMLAGRLAWWWWLIFGVHWHRLAGLV